MQSGSSARAADKTNQGVNAKKCVAARSKCSQAEPAGLHSLIPGHCTAQSLQSPQLRDFSSVMPASNPAHRGSDTTKSGAEVAQLWRWCGLTARLSREYICRTVVSTAVARWDLYQIEPNARHWRNTPSQMLMECYPHRQNSNGEGLSHAWC